MHSQISKNGAIMAKTSRFLNLKPSVRNLGNRGQGLTEYLILLVLIAVISIVAVQSLGGTIKDKLQVARKHINSVSVEE